MKKLFLLLTIITVWISLTWCTQNKLSQAELFDANIKCLGLKENYMLEIFYSPVKNNCIYTQYFEWITIIVDYWKVWKWATLHEYYSNGIDAWDIKSREKFDKVLQELKWE